MQSAAFLLHIIGQSVILFRPAAGSSFAVISLGLYDQAEAAGGTVLRCSVEWGGTASPTARSCLRSPIGAPPEPHRSTSDSNQRYYGEAPGWPAGRSGAGWRNRGPEPGHRLARDPSGKPSNPSIGKSDKPCRRKCLWFSHLTTSARAGLATPKIEQRCVPARVPLVVGQ
jgi:hypothetical protein